MLQLLKRLLLKCVENCIASYKGDMRRLDVITFFGEVRTKLRVGSGRHTGTRQPSVWEQRGENAARNNRERKAVVKGSVDNWLGRLVRMHS